MTTKTDEVVAAEIVVSAKALEDAATFSRARLAEDPRAEGVAAAFRAELEKFAAAAGVNAAIEVAELAAAARAMSEEKPDDWIDVGFLNDASGRAVEGSRLPKLDVVVVDLVEEVGGRVTTWAIECPTHGRFPLDVRGQTEAIVVGGRHVEAEHFGRGKLRRSRRRKR